MTLIAPPRVALFAAIVAVSVTAGAAAQTTVPEPHRPHMTMAQATPGQSQGAQPAQPGMMPPGMTGQGTTGQGMMGQGMMGQGMMGRGMGGMMRSGMMGGMPMMGGRGHMMKVMFAIADTDGDGALSFEEVTAIHKRIFDKVDASKDGKVTIEEVQTFMRE